MYWVWFTPYCVSWLVLMALEMELKERLAQRNRLLSILKSLKRSVILLINSLLQVWVAYCNIQRVCILSQRLYLRYRRLLRAA